MKAFVQGMGGIPSVKVRPHLLTETAALGDGTAQRIGVWGWKQAHQDGSPNSASDQLSGLA